MGEQPDHWRAFRKRWPAFLPTELYSDSVGEIQRNVERAKHPITGNMPRIIETTRIGVEVRQLRRTEYGEWVDFREPEILRLRNLLREAWRGGQTAQQSIEELLGLRGPSLPAAQELPAPDQGEKFLPPLGISPRDRSVSISADWQRSRIVYVPQNEFQASCYALLCKSNLAKFCANPDCPAPHFVATRAIQRYCSPDCLKPFQKEWKLEWWNREGKKRRAKARNQSRKRR